MNKRIAVIGLVLLMASAIVGAQDWQAAPTYGSVELDSGFIPDPYTVSLTAGGPINLSGASLGISAYGYVANAPDFDLYYEAGGFDLTIKVQNASGDTVILINAPDGSWHFNDDFEGLNAGVTFTNPMSGLYDIWVGTFSDGLLDATLAITELN